MHTKKAILKQDENSLSYIRNHLRVDNTTPVIVLISRSFPQPLLVAVLCCIFVRQFYTRLLFKHRPTVILCFKTKTTFLYCVEFINIKTQWGEKSIAIKVNFGKTGAHTKELWTYQPGKVYSHKKIWKEGM